MDQTIKFPAWFDAISDGSTPMCEALKLGKAIVGEFIQRVPNCCRRRYDNGDNLLFREGDFANPAGFAVLRELLQAPDPQVVSLPGRLVLAASDEIGRVQLLREIVTDDDAALPLDANDKRRLRDVMSRPLHVRTPPPPPDWIAENAALPELGDAAAQAASWQSAPPPAKPRQEDPPPASTPSQTTPANSTSTDKSTAGMLVHTFRHPTSDGTRAARLWSVHFLDGGRQAVSLGEDGSLRFWDLFGMKETRLTNLNRNREESYRAAAVSPLGDYRIVGGSGVVAEVGLREFIPNFLTGPVPGG